MAKVIDNPITEGFSGKFGKLLVFRHMRDGRTIVVSRPDFSNRVFSQEQLTHQSRFQQAAAYARVAAKTHPIYAELAQQRVKPAYNIALSDWFHPPVIHEVTLRDGSIHVKASDNVQVTKVLITISDNEGNMMEQGQATMKYDTFWEYATSVEGNIIVEAFDLPGNCTKHEA